MKTNLKIGLFGYGCVGTGLYQVLHKSELIDAKIKRICVKNKEKKRDLPDGYFTFDKNDILLDNEINLVVELIDDAEAAYLIVKSAIISGKNVVTANKKMVAYHFSELHELSIKHGVSFLYEASVCGSIPVIRNLEEYYNNDSLSALKGICNGTTNYILTKQIEENKSYESVLKNAQELGFAESNPTMDVDGYDSKFKLLILIAHAFGLVLQPNDILNIGIRNINENIIQYAKEKEYKIKLISYAKKINNKIFSFVAPCFIEKENPLSSVSNEFNAVQIQALFSDSQTFFGKGAGSFPTASAVLSDISALQYQYKYELHKVNNNQAFDSNQFTVKVFLSSKEKINILLKEKLNIIEEFKAENYNYLIAETEFETLKNIDWNQQEISIVFFPDSEKEIGAKEKNLAYQFEELN